MKFKDAVKLFVGTIIVLGIAMAVLGFSGKSIDKTIIWIIPIGTSFIFSAFVGELIERYTGDFFKKIYLSFKISEEDRVNIPLFVILVFIIKSWWFG
jgi:membrane glycosyltransferase